MQVASAQVPTSTDVATMIAESMRRLGVLGMPRNYEIFYEACTGTNEALRRDLRALGPRPSQDGLDAIGRKYFAGSQGSEIIADARDRIAAQIEEVMALLRRERASLEKYGVILDKSVDGLSTRDAITKDILLKIVGIMTSATESTIDQGRQTAVSIDGYSAELQQVKSKLEEYKKLADTDPLTKLNNRRAFDRSIAGVYVNDRKRMFGALILADIDRFKSINDRHGHPVGDRILQIVAEVMTANAEDGMFVARTGGEEFAVIAEGLSEERMLQTAEKIRTAVEATSFVNRDNGIDYGPVTLSFGLCMASDAESADDLYAKADRALYSSKILGRNRVTRHADEELGQARKNWFIYRRD